jgi:hypothetical protein
LKDIPIAFRSSQRNLESYHARYAGRYGRVLALGDAVFDEYDSAGK